MSLFRMAQLSPKVLAWQFHMNDTEYYSDPNIFESKRFLKLGELLDNTNRYQFVTTSADHIGFGYGKHAW